LNECFAQDVFEFLHSGVLNTLALDVLPDEPKLLDQNE
jgi:lactate dehydrogenase-like 2-hydroxyacid dehydrogenase